MTSKITGDISIVMEMTSTAAVEALGALAQEHRLALFRLLVQAGDDGMPAGAIAAMNALVGYLMENCCGGAACAPAAQCGEDAAQPQERISA